MDKQTEVLPLTAALGAAVIGILVYLLDRPPDSVYFIPDWFYLTDNLYPIFGNIGNYLPTFIHVYVFILLTYVVVLPSDVMVYPICIAWLAVDCLFELAQLRLIAEWIAVHVPAWFTGIPFLENTTAYFLAGTFDTLDLISIAMGTVAAYLTIKYSSLKRKRYVSED